VKSVDLRCEYEQVYDQSYNASCGPHATTAALDCIYERTTGKPHRFDKQHIWDWCRFHQGMGVDNRGIVFDSLRKTLSLNGVKLGEQIIKGFALKRTEFLQDWETPKHLLCMGVPQILIIRAGTGFDHRNNGKPWREHRWGDLPSLIDNGYTHAVCLVGFDDDAKCWLVENSWGAEWGDGGFFGIPYDQMSYMHEEMWNINELPIHPKPVEGYTVTVPILLTADRAAFADRAAPALLRHLMDAFGTGGAQALIAECKAWGVSDKHLEALAGWPRGSVRAFQADNPGLDWTGFVFDQL
jgi:hypothetical protein